MLVFVFLLILVQDCSCQDKTYTHTLHIIAVLSDEESSNENIPWTRGTEIFHGACLAAQDINKHPDLLKQFEVVPVPVLVPDCDPVKGIHKLLEVLLDPSMNVVGVTGMFCNKVAEVYSPIIRLWKRNLLQVLGSSLPHIKERQESHYTSYILPSSKNIAGAVISLLHTFNWTKFGIVYAQASYNSQVNFNYWTVAKALIGIINARYNQIIHILLDYEMETTNSLEVSLFLQELKSSEANIFVLLVPPKTASSTIQEVVKEGLVWPQYVWIFVLLDVLAFVSFSLFVIFRKERQVKAASINLGMCIFRGSYLMLLASTSNVLQTGLQANNELSLATYCNVVFPLVWISLWQQLW